MREQINKIENGKGANAEQIDCENKIEVDQKQDD